MYFVRHSLLPSNHYCVIFRVPSLTAKQPSEPFLVHHPIFISEPYVSLLSRQFDPDPLFSNVRIVIPNMFGVQTINCSSDIKLFSGRPPLAPHQPKPRFILVISNESRGKMEMQVRKINCRANATPDGDPANDSRYEFKYFDHKRSTVDRQRKRL